jgi:hypothetical protein
MVRYQKNLLYSILHSYTLKENSIDEEQTLKMFTQDEKKSSNELWLERKLIQVPTRTYQTSYLMVKWQS